MRTRPLANMLTDVVGSLLDLDLDHGAVRATRVELMLPIDVKLRRSNDELVFFADIPAWRWRCDWDPPFGKLRLTLEETGEGIDR